MNATAESPRRGLPRTLARVAAAGLAVLMVEVAACLPPDGPQVGPAGSRLPAPSPAGRIANAAVRESSGLVASRRHDGVFWTHNDSGNPPTLFAIDSKGKALGRYRLTGARNRDWEDIAADEAGRLYVADVGDNARARTELTLYALPEPDPHRAGRADAQVAGRLKYPPGHGPQDCEAVFVRRRWAYLVTKELRQARLFRARLGGEAARAVEAEYLGVLPGSAWVTGADISADGRHLAVLSYSAVCVYDLPAPLEELVRQAATRGSPGTGASGAIRGRPRRRAVSLGQCEAICWTSGGKGPDLLITNEGRQLHRIRGVLGSATGSAPCR